MKIVLNTQNNDLINEFILYCKQYSIEIVNAKSEKKLFDHIILNNVDAFILEHPSFYIQKAINLIKKKYPYTPVVLIGNMFSKISNVDIYLPSYDILYDDLIISCINNINVYINNFQKLKKLTSQINDSIHFGSYIYDPTRRIFSHNEMKIKLSAKEGGIIEILSSNFGEIVKREIVLEKVWRKSDYFASRSMDVYLTNLRKKFRKNNINLNINNISGLGLILE